MKYLIKESQIDLLSEIERNWMEKEYEEGYNDIKEILTSFITGLFDSYGEIGNEIVIYDEDKEVIFSYMKPSGELYYDYSLNDLYSKLFPHPFWSVHSKYAMSDAFEQSFPQYKVNRVKGAHIIYK